MPGIEETRLVSVIVPVRDDAARISRCLDALLAQSYAAELREIIIVDNGSTDGTREVAAGYPVRLLVEDARPTPYLARNCGIRAARGQVFALTDADCIPAPNWIELGVHALESRRADLVGGKVTFSFSAARTAGESYDAISNLEMKNNIEKRGVAKTANLFFRRSVVERIGMFPSDVRSGGDVLWTGAATRAGLKLVYAPNVEVIKPARRFGALIRKQYRVGKGQPTIWREGGAQWSDIAARILVEMRPPSPSSIRGIIRERGSPEMEAEIVPIWCVAWACQVTTNLGRLRALLELAR